MSIEAMKLALEALQLSKPKLMENTFRYVAHDLAIAALRAAIEQAQEPVQELVCVCGAIWEGQELVSTPLPRQWQGLTDEELAEFSELKLGAYDLCLEVEAKLKEKNT